MRSRTICPCLLHPLGSDTDAGGVKPVTCQVTLGGREPRYKCKDHSHLTRNVAQVDRLVFGHVLYALTHPRAYELLASPPPEVDAEGLRAERTAIRQRLEVMAEDEVLGLKTRAKVIAATKRGNARITEIDELLNATASSDPLAAVVDAPDPVQAWCEPRFGRPAAVRRPTVHGDDPAVRTTRPGL